MTRKYTELPRSGEVTIPEHFEPCSQKIAGKQGMQRLSMPRKT
ncbi:MAG TPA: hypothetical protein VH088_08990 [Terriglobales bacterium]|nr:hypothetical protein [Terriglobales bacterium]